MAVRPGYNQTEVGLIPEDWEVRLLCDVVDFANGKPHERYVESDGRYWLITLDSVGIDGRLKKDHKKTNLPESPLEKDDIVSVLSDLAHGSLLGLCDLIPADNTYVLNQRMGRLRLKVPASPRFVRLQINRRQDHFRKRGQGTSQKHVYRRDFDSLPIPFPRPPEQDAIAGVLSDADALIESLEQLLSKKRYLKQGAMQELLTGKKRLPGFREEWITKKLGALAEIRSGGTPSTSKSQFWDGDIPWCTPTDVTGLNGFKYLSDTSRKISQFGLKASSAEIIPANSVVMTSRATIGECAINRVPISTNQGFKNFTPFENVNVDFLYYLLLTQKQGFISLCGGSTFLEIGRAELAAFAVCVPTTKAEQTAIADVLSDMDEEIATLEAELTKARQLKQGMMQALLTGTIRLA